VPESVALANQGALKLAGLSGNMEMLQWLLDRGLTPGDDDLELAVEMQQVDVVKMLLDAGIQLPLERRLNSTFKSVFEKANLEILPLLLAKVPEPLLPKALEEDRPVSLLRKTLAKGDLAKARLLIEKGADVNHPRPNESVMTRRMLFSYDQGGSETLSVISQAVRIADWDFIKLVLDKGASPDRREPDGNTPLHHSAANRDSSILKYFLDKQPNQTKEDLHEAIQTAASSGRLEQVKLLEQAGANLDDIDIINASFRSQNLDLIEYLIQKAKKPLSKNEAWRFALGALDYVIWSEGNLNPNLTNLDFAKIRNIATVMIENGLQSTNIQNAGDVANLTKEKLEALEKREEEEEEIGVDSDGDGVDDWTEETLVGGYDPNDPDNFPTPEEIWAAKAADAATADQ
jgi:ankyrin repeat protein